MALKAVPFAAMAAAYVASARVLHEDPGLPDGWRALGDSVEPGRAVPVKISLKQQNLDELYRVAYSVSDPSGPQYGRYLSSAAIAKMTAPSEDDVMKVESWLAAAGVPFARAGETIEASFTAGTASELLECTFSFVANDATGQRALRASAYYLPDAIQESVSAVYGMHGLPLPLQSPIVASSAGPSSPKKITPAGITETYKVSGVKPSGSNATRQAVAEFQGQTMKVSDLTKFFSKFVPDAPASTGTVSKFVGKGDKGTGGIEAMLDIEYIMGVSPGLQSEFWYWGGQDFCGDLKDWTNTILNTEGGPLVHSVSYGWQGQLSKIGCKKKARKDVDHNFAKIAAKGITIVFASGDSGSGYDPLSKKLYASWPASSPWVTAVGSTRFVDNKAQPEMATDQFGSGGGFSTMFPAFKDQQAAVQKYLSSGVQLPPKSFYNASRRATPDVSGLGEGYQVIANGQTQSVGGTSASTPMFAGLVSLLNEARHKAGKPPMGYLNPWLYQHPEVFNDVTVGTNAIGRGGEKLKYGWKCTKGWDPATGLGTPNFGKMLAAAVPSEDVVVV